MYYNKSKAKNDIFKLRSRMINVRNNFRNKYEDLMCLRCKKGLDDGKHLFTKYENLSDIKE